MNTNVFEAKGLWLTWERHRRSMELAKRLNVPIQMVICQKKPYLVKVIINSIRSVCIILKKKPSYLFVQNPSMVLALVACILKSLCRFVLVVDRHSNFKFETKRSKRLKYILFHFISRYTIKKADLTIVTNEFLEGVVQSQGGRAVVLPDAIPHLNCADADTFSLNTSNNIVFICTYSDDEPVEEVLRAISLSSESVTLYVTGRVPERIARLDLSANIVLTGFLTEAEYQSLLFKCDGIIVLTKKEHLLLCGAYEALSLYKPLILSNTNALKGYFSSDGVIFCENERSSIAKSIDALLQEKAFCIEKNKLFVFELNKRWERVFVNFVKTVVSLKT